MKTTINKRIKIEVEIDKCLYCDCEEVGFIKYNIENIGTVFHVYCKKCRTHGPYGKNKDEAVTKWNEMSIQ
jgi:hypothetical protein